jgi:ubiquinone biosynthesis monooxygenase Coq7
MNVQAAAEQRQAPALPAPPLPVDVLADLRTDHAGETGAVCIYDGVLRFARDPVLREFAQRHQATERHHLELIEACLPPARRSRLLPLWRIAGWLTGAVPALFGPAAVYATIEAVERFVDAHYAEQIERLDDRPALWALRDLLVQCRLDEIEHREEAAARCMEDRAPTLRRAWAWLVEAGSKAAVGVCRRI